MNPKKSTGWIITSAALGINLLLGLLYAWSVFKKALVAEWGWNDVTASLPFTVSAAIFAFIMIFAGRAQDKYGPRIIALLGGIMFGLGLIASGFSKNPAVMVLTFGVIGGIGIGLGYSATTPCAIKWFHPSKKGIISGIVVSGVGLAPVYIAPLTNFFIQRYGIEQTFIILGVIALVAIVLFSLILKNPSADYVPVQPVKVKKSATSQAVNLGWAEMLKHKQFYMLWSVYLLSATAGLMLIAHIASIAGTQAAWKAGFILVVILSAFNALGRIIIGFLSDKIGRRSSLIVVFLFQAVNMFLFTYFKSIPLLIIGTAIAGLAYGSLFSLMPSITADYFGLKNLGVNYGLVFSGWGIAAIIGPILGGFVVVKSGTYTLSYIVSGVLLLVGKLLVWLVKTPVNKNA
ncbi:MAG: OFA family MFS transporter [Bacteroidales bacterium]|nr:OFA family MFS transporter [Bacteroidales bacterium]